MKKENSYDLHYEYFSAVRQRKVKWLWYPYIPYGKLTILQGDPGEGKSTFMLNIAALLTKGEAFPNGHRVQGPQNVVYQTAEDNLADTVKPRLMIAGADCSRIAYIADDEYSLTLEDQRIEQVIQQTHAKLFILDPLQAYLSQDSDMMNAGKMRCQLSNLCRIAARYDCAVVIIGHMNKSSSEKNLYRGLGSIDIAAIARSVLMIARDRLNPSIRYMFPVKSSLAPEGVSIAFSLDGEKGLVWHGDCQIDKSSLLGNKPDENKKGLAIKIMSQSLRCSDIHSAEIMNKLRLLGISARTVQTAKKELGITSYRRGGIWFWHFPQNRDKKG